MGSTPITLKPTEAALIANMTPQNSPSPTPSGWPRRTMPIVIATRTVPSRKSRIVIRSGAPSVGGKNGVAMGNSVALAAWPGSHSMRHRK
jgi:hypothetical protein